MHLIGQRLFGGVRLLGQGPCPANVNRLDMLAVPWMVYSMQRGMQVDLAHFKRMEIELSQDMDRITEEVHSMTGYYVNLDSGDQVSDLLFNKLGLKQAQRKMTNSGDRESVADEVLTAIQHDHEVIPLIQDFKEYSKLRGTYVVPMPKLARKSPDGTWRMYPNLGHTRVPSGRFNCKEPNLLAIPTRTKRGREVRKGFITDPGWVYLSVDLSQIEPRVEAYLSGDEGLTRVYHDGEDVYSDFATAAFALEDKRYFDADKHKWIYPTVHPNDHRFPAKTCVLASIYDVTGKGLLEQMPVICANCKTEASNHNKKGYPECPKFRSYWTEEGCDKLIVAFYQKYPKIMEHRRRNHRRLRRYGYLWDMWGRTLHVAGVYSVLPWIVSKALRESGNFPDQSSAQGLAKIGQGQNMHDFEEEGYLGDVVHPLLQIHDELLMECRADVAEDLAYHIKYRFENSMRLDDVPIKAGSAVAEIWGELEK